jgi:hypothetical protein
MARRIVDDAGVTWRVGLSGRSTSYGRDELSLQFQRLDAPTETRFCRFSPRGAKAGEMALEESTDRELLALLDVAQVAWTAAEAGHGRSS